MLTETLSKLETLGPVGIKIRSIMNERYDFLNKESNGPLKSGIVRMIDKHKIDYNMMIQLSYSIVATGTTEGQNLIQLAIAIGNRIRNYYKLPTKAELDLRLGVFVLNAYALNNMLIIKLVNDFKSFNKAKTVYKVYMGYNRSDMRKLMKEFNEVHDPFKPLFTKAPEWEFGTVLNPNGESIKLIKQSKIDTIARINKHNTPIVLNATNKKQAVAFYVNPEVYEIYKWALQTNQHCFEHNSVDTIAKERKEAKKAEALQVLKATELYVGKKFYQQYTCDSRGRFYPLSAYLNELNSDNAKGMLSFFEGKPLGNNGKAQLFHHIANMWGEDKLSHADRVKFVEDNYYEFVTYGSKPKDARGWMQAAEPIQFLSAVIELAKLDKHFVANGTVEDFISHTICYRDGSNNGLQWLFSLVKDNKNGHLVNIKPTTDNKPGDMYNHVAVSVKDIMHNKAKEEDNLSLDYYNLYFKSIEKIRNRWRIAELNNDKNVENKKRLIKWYQKRYRTELKLTDIIYWDKAKFTIKEWRKIVKRNVMTYGYSATKQGMGEQIIQDTRDIDNVYLSNKQHSAARALGSLVYTTIETEFPEVAAAMKLFKDNCAAYMKKHNKQYSHNTLISNFPFTQHYVKYKSARVKLTDGLYIMNNDKSFKWVNRVDFVIKTELPILNIGKAKAAISPNSIHNLDSLHLMLVIDECDFDIVSAHDSYGAHACNVNMMQKVIRSQFKRIIDANPLQHNLNETGNLVPMIKQGQLDSSEILKSEFAFA
ncbi:RNA polymerase [Pelagibacter phage Aegir EXVC013S]|nr:RNA polymerase [Pelagibacter phage Aegir EXVC013S]QLF88491.1 RNA polymerase [Pelagibacter phage Kolga EXVC016S]